MPSLPSKPITLLFSLCLLSSLLYLYRSTSSSPSPSSILIRPSKPPALLTPPSALSVHKKRIIVVGDIHGDLSHFTKILRRAGVVDFKNSWVGGETVLVQTGDIVDRGKDTIALYRLMDGLRPQAEKVGGAVVSLLGNHELMNAMGDWRYVTKEDIASFGGERQRRDAMTSGWIGQTWRTNYSVTARVPYVSSSYLISSLPLLRGAQVYLSSPHVSTSKSNFENEEDKDPFTYAAASFVHGGILPSYIKSLSAKENGDTNDPVGKINEIGRGLLFSLVENPSPLSLPRDASDEQRLFWSERGPMWDRSYALDEDEEAMCKRVDEATKLLKVRRLIMGHTPNFEGIRTRCDGKVVLIDTGISRAYGGALSALEILVTLVPEAQSEDPEYFEIGDELEEVDPLAKRRAGSVNADEGQAAWLEREVVSALYADLSRGKEGKEVLAKSERVVLLNT